MSGLRVALLAGGAAACVFGLWWLWGTSIRIRKERTAVSYKDQESWEAQTWVLHFVRGPGRLRAERDMRNLAEGPDNAGVHHVVCMRCWAIDEQNK